MPTDTVQNRPSASSHRGGGVQEDTQIDRFELKYILHPSLVPAIRKFIEPFVDPDHHAGPGIPEYTVTTLQLDSPSNVLHYAKEREAIARFKLRIRTYGTAGKTPYFLEIKRKVNSAIFKSRVILHPGDYNPSILLEPNPALPLMTDAQYTNYLEFVRLTRSISARPKIFIRYIRESYKGVCETYSRVTLDRALQYRPAKGSWFFPIRAKKWYCLDTPMALGAEFSGHVLELKCGSEMPGWMLELIERFNLVKIGFSKYSAAMRMESIYMGMSYSDASENCSYDHGPGF